MKRLLPYLLSLAAAAIILASVLELSTLIGLVPWVPSLVAAALCSLGAAVFAYLTQSGSWTWGLLTSSACWVFLLFTFVSLWALDSFSWWPFLDAVIVTATACAGGSIGRHFADTRSAL